MSPTINRSRSSSVTAFLNGGRHICTSSSANGLLALTTTPSTSSNMVGNEYGSANNAATPCNSMQTPVSVSASPYDDSDQQSPSNYNLSGFSHTPTYNIDWSDVNTLELDFPVYKSLPNIRKQLSPNEVWTRGFYIFVI